MYTEGSVPLCVMTHDKRDRSALPLATEGTQEMTASFFLPQRGERKNPPRTSQYREAIPIYYLQLMRVTLNSR